MKHDTTFRQFEAGKKAAAKNNTKKGKLHRIEIHPAENGHIVHVHHSAHPAEQAKGNYAGHHQEMVFTHPGKMMKHIGAMVGAGSPSQQARNSPAANDADAQGAAEQVM